MVLCPFHLQPVEEHSLSGETPAFLPNPRSLHLRYSRTHSNLPSYIHAPNLTELEIIEDPEDLFQIARMGKKTQTLSWLDGYGAQLTSFAFAACAALSKYEFIQCLSRLPMLEHLKILSQGELVFHRNVMSHLRTHDICDLALMDAEVLGLLAPGAEGDSECLLPKLKSLDMKFDDDYPFGRESVVRFVEARRRNLENRTELVRICSQPQLPVTTGTWVELERSEVDLTDFKLILSPDIQ